MTTAATPEAVPGPSQRSTLRIIVHYAFLDFWRTLRIVESTFFIVALPSVIYVMFGVLPAYSDQTVGHGNVAGYQMISMAIYGAVTATTSIAGSAATERQRGWGRQLGLTALSSSGYIVAKVLVATALATLPVIVIYVVGAMTGAEMDSLGIALSTAVLCVVGAVPFALYGLAAALLFRSDGAVSAASGLLVVLAFFGNLFMPLSDSLLAFARFTPLYGSTTLARWPLLEGVIISDGSVTASDPLWVPLLSVVSWAVIFGAICWFAARRTTHRN